MKTSLRLILSAAFICSLSIVTSFGKGYTIPVHSRNIIKYDTLTTVIQLQVVNPSTSSLTLKYTILNDGFAFSGWGYSFCDLNSCFTSAYQSNNTDILSGSDTSAFSITITSFRSHPQTENMTIKIWDVNDPTHPDTLSMTINGDQLGIQNIAVPSSFVGIYPNPAADYINLQVNQTAFAPVKAIVFNTLGKMVSEQNITEGTSTLPVYDLSKGIYILSLRDQYGREARKQFVKE